MNFCSAAASGAWNSPAARPEEEAPSEPPPPPRLRYSPLGTYEVTCRMSSR